MPERPIEGANNSSPDGGAKRLACIDLAGLCHFPYHRGTTEVDSRRADRSM